MYLMALHYVIEICLYQEEADGQNNMYRTANVIEICLYLENRLANST